MERDSSKKDENNQTLPLPHQKAERFRVDKEKGERKPEVKAIFLL
jgi:hypothetical protein